ncbi:hypothetical protein [Flavobacterium sp. 25HG05S-40]
MVERKSIVDSSPDSSGNPFLLLNKNPFDYAQGNQQYKRLQRMAGAVV